MYKMTRTVWRLILCFHQRRDNSPHDSLEKMNSPKYFFDPCYFMFCLQETTEIAILNLCEYTNRQSIFISFIGV